MPPLSKRSEKGLLTPDNCVVAFIDLQPGLLAGVASVDRQQVAHNNLMLAKTAALFGVPTVLTAIERTGASAALLAALHAVFPAQALHLRSSMNSWDDAGFVDTVRVLGRARLLLAGLWTGTGIALPAIQALADGYDVYVVEDCCCDVSVAAHENAMQRMIDAGARPVTARSVMLEWQRDWALPGTSDAILDIARAHSGVQAAEIAFAGAPVPRATRPVLPGYLGHAAK